LTIDIRALQAAALNGDIPFQMLFAGGDNAWDLQMLQLLGSGQSLAETDLQTLEGRIRTRINDIGIENWRKDWDARFQKLRPGAKGRTDGESCSLDYVSNEEILVQPDVMLTQTPRVPGLDGRKMSKSYNNSIALGESDEDVRKKTRGMLTDPARKLRTDPGNPDVCPVFDWHKLFSTPEAIQRVNRDCRTAAIGCVDCKHVMADALIRWIEPVRARRKEYESKPGEVLEILDAGSKKAREVAKSTMGRVREAVFGWQKTRGAITGGATTAKRNVKAKD
jgi:hypothetical protein